MFRAKESAPPKNRAARNRLPSYEANRHLTSKASRYRETLDQAQESDEVVRGKMDEIDNFSKTLFYITKTMIKN